MISDFNWIGNVLVARLRVQRLDAAIAGDVKRVLIEQIATRDARLLLNCKDVAFVDSSGLGALISVLKHAAASSWGFGLCEVRPPVAQLLRLTRLDRVITVWATEAEGVAGGQPNRET